ncbi:hypothetical protein FRC02_001296, partial [Tulasnella sp. 418]
LDSKIYHQEDYKALERRLLFAVEKIKKKRRNRRSYDTLSGIVDSMINQMEQPRAQKEEKEEEDHHYHYEGGDYSFD